MLFLSRAVEQQESTLFCEVCDFRILTPSVKHPIFFASPQLVMQRLNDLVLLLRDGPGLRDQIMIGDGGLRPLQASTLPIIKYIRKKKVN